MRGGCFICGDTLRNSRDSKPLYLSVAQSTGAGTLLGEVLAICAICASTNDYLADSTERLGRALVTKHKRRKPGWRSSAKKRPYATIPQLRFKEITENEYLAGEILQS